MADNLSKSMISALALAEAEVNLLEGPKSWVQNINYQSKEVYTFLVEYAYYDDRGTKKWSKIVVTVPQENWALGAIEYIYALREELDRGNVRNGGKRTNSGRWYTYYMDLLKSDAE